MSFRFNSAVGSKVEKWLSTPFDIVAFGGRAGLGALVSLPTRLQTLQYDVERVVELLQDPRSIDEKAAVVLKEVEDTVVEFLEKGVVLEVDILANLKTVLPAEVASIITEFVPAPPNSLRAEAEVEPMDDYPMAAPPVTYQSTDVLPNQVAAEMTEIKNAVIGLKLALDSMRVNVDASRVMMLKLTLKEARDQLARRLQEVSPMTSSDPTISAATVEATALLREVDAQFF
ncbi:MAG: hypothetical protein WDW38_000677 [Sanguina aurantia]